MFVFILSSLIQFLFIFYFFSKPLIHLNKRRITPPTKFKELSVSIIVAARNEASNLPQLIPAICEQNYSHFEVIIVNDRSTDQSAQLLKKALAQYSHLKVLNIDTVPEGISPKKYALTRAIEYATGEILLLTDADCLPTSNKWVETMVKPFNNSDVAIVLGVGLYQKYPTFLNYLIQYETIFTALQYISYALKGIPYMGVGRNICYRKDLFLKKGGFSNTNHILGGDDSLFINQCATRNNTSVVFSPQSHTYSEPEKTWCSWYRQKRRHLSTGQYFKIRDKILLGLWPASQILMYLSALYLIYTTSSYFCVLNVLLLRFFLLGYVVFFFTRYLKGSANWLWVPLLELSHLMYQLIIGAISMLKQKKTWN